MNPSGPTWLITTERHLSAEQVATIMRDWRERYSGQLLILPPGMSIKRLLAESSVPLHVVAIGEHLFIEASYNPLDP